MKIAVLGTGVVGQAHAGKLASLGHEVIVGTKDVKQTLSKTQPDAMGRPPFSKWLINNPKLKLASFADAADASELIIEALSGKAVIETLSAIKSELAKKVLIDISNPLDFSRGMPPTLFVCNDDSLAEQIQKALPDTLVVKAFNTMNASIQVDPKHVASGDHHLLICGSDKGAKTKVTTLAKEQYGWSNIIDLGDLTAARGMEMVLPLWLKVMSAKGTADFNFKIAS